MDVIGSEPDLSTQSIADYRDFIVERLTPTGASQPTMDRDRIQRDLIKRLGGEYPLDPTPLMARTTVEFETTRIGASMPGAWCVIGHDPDSIAWLSQYADSFKARRVSGCFLIHAVDQAGFDAMRAITPVPLYRVQGQTLWHIHALSFYPVVLVGNDYQGTG